MTRLARLFLATLVVSVGVLATQTSPADPGQLNKHGITDQSCTRADYDRGVVQVQGRNYLCRYLPDARTFAWSPAAPLPDPWGR